MRIRALIAAVVLTAALTIPANAFAYLTWFEFTRQSNSASPLTMAWQYGPGYYGTQTWRAGSGVCTGEVWAQRRNGRALVEPSPRTKRRWSR